MGLAQSNSLIEYVHGGHIGGPKQKNDIPLGNKCYFYANIFNCFGPPTWPPCTYSIGHFGKYHNNLCLPPTFCKHCFQFLVGLTMVPRENKNNAHARFGGKTKSIMVFPLISSTHKDTV